MTATAKEKAVETDLDQAEGPVLHGFTEADTRSVHERLVAILGELPAIGKESHNTQQNFMYRSHDDVLNALNPLLAKHGVVIVPYRIAERVTGERTTSGNKTMYEVNLRVAYRIYGRMGDYVEAQAWGEGTDMGDKSTNKAMTMAFKNVIAQTFSVSTADTIDADGGSPEQTTRSGPVRRSQASNGFDPGKDLVPGAIEGEGFQGRLRQVMDSIDPAIDWGALLGQAMSVRFGVRARADIEEARLPEFWTRLSNAVSKLAQENDLSAFPPFGQRADGEAAVIAAFTWAFGPFTEPLTIPRTKMPDPVAEDPNDIPWVEEVEAAIQKEKTKEEESG